MRAGVFLAASDASSDEEEVMFVERQGGLQADQATPLHAAGRPGAWAEIQESPRLASGRLGAWADDHESPRLAQEEEGGGGKGPGKGWGDSNDSHP